LVWLEGVEVLAEEEGQWEGKEAREAPAYKRHLGGGDEDAGKEVVADSVLVWLVYAGSLSF
jgi:hypothetical protein